MIIWTCVLYYTIHLTQLTLNTRTTSNSRHSEFITPAKRETNSLCQTTIYLLIYWLISTQTVVHCASETYKKQLHLTMFNGGSMLAGVFNHSTVYT